MTLKDIAELANTSVSTVSRCLNDSALVSTATKQRVKAIAEEHGFEFNAMARGLATRSVGTIGVILPEYFDRFDVLMYHAALHSDLRRSLEQADLDMIVAFKENRFSGVHNIEKLVTRKKVDGLILVRSSLDDDTRTFLEQREIPFVLTQYPPENSAPAYDVVYSDSWSGGRLVAEHLLSQGFRSPVVISGGAESQSVARMEGFRTTLASGGVELHEGRVLTGDWQIGTATRLVQDNFELVRSADVLFAFNDLMAFGALQALHAGGVNVPGDIALVGYDDTPLAASTIPGVTSVHQAHEEIAELACELLLELIARKVTKTGETRSPRATAIQPRLVVRESSRMHGATHDTRTG